MSRKDHFIFEPTPADVRQRTIQGGFLTILAQVIKFTSHLIGTAILGRLLTPEDFGLIAMVAVFTQFFSTFKDFGLAEATVQRREISHEQVSNLFWFNVLMCSLVGVGVSALSPIVAWFYDEPRTQAITIVVASAAFFTPLSIQHQALLRRRMEFRRLVVIDVLATVGSYAVAVIIAALTHSYWAIVSIGMANLFIRIVGLWSSCSWFPSWPQRNAPIAGMVAFGGNLVGSNVLNYLEQTLDKLLVGWLYGASTLGLYSKAYGLLMMPVRQFSAPVTDVAVSSLSRLQSRPTDYQRVFLSLLEKLAAITTGLAVFTIFGSDWIVRICLGPQWTASATIFAWFSLGAIALPVGNAVRWLFISQGRTSEMFRWSLIATVTSVISFLLGSPLGAVGIAASYSLVTALLNLPLLFWSAGQSGPVSTRQIYGAILPSWPCALGMSLALAAYRAVAGDLPAVVGLGGMLPIACVVWFAMLMATARGRLMLHDLWRLRNRLRAQNSETVSIQPTVEGERLHPL